MPAMGGSFNGLAFGPGSSFPVYVLEGYEDLPDVRASDQLRTGDHGAWEGLDLAAPRRLVLGLRIKAATAAAFQVLADQVRAATVIQKAELPLTLDGSTKRVYVKPRRRSIPLEINRKLMSADALIEFVGTDPRIYSEALYSPQTGLAQSSGGMTFNATFPLGFGSTGLGGLIQVTNNGNFPTRPLLTINGPVDNPIVDDLTTLQSLFFGISLAAADTLVIDTDVRSINLNPTATTPGASRRSSLLAASAWFELGPGASTLRFRNNGIYQAAAGLRVDYRDAWL